MAMDHVLIIHYLQRAFTLIELSIVLVIIGLIVGGVLVRQDLIRAAEARAQITQIEKYNSAVNTFRGKFNGIPGDLAVSSAQQFGFLTAGCTGASALRDGNGLIDGGGSPFYFDQGLRETGMFWEDLSNPIAGNLIDGVYPGGNATAITCAVGVINMTGTTLLNYFPQAKIGYGNMLYVFEDGTSNWFGVSAVTSLSGGTMFSGTTIPVIEAYKIDSKVDDGLPATGSVVAKYINADQQNLHTPPNTATSGGTSSSCFDTTTSTYSITVNNGNGGNCALSFRFQ